MAQHYPIGQGGFDIVFKHVIKRIHVTRLNNFQRELHEKAGVQIMRLPVHEYRMDNEHGKKDHYVVHLYKEDDYTYSYEVHLDRNWNVNAVYQVL